MQPAFRQRRCGVEKITGLKGRRPGGRKDQLREFLLCSRKRIPGLGEKGLRHFLWSRDIGDLKLGGTRTRWGRGRRRRWICCSMIAWCRLRGGWEKRGRG